MKTILFDNRKEDLIEITTKQNRITVANIVSIFLLNNGFFEINFNNGETAIVNDVVGLLKRRKEEKKNENNSDKN
jgi:hypothetical protein